MTINKIPVWLDCDPGHDDAIALLLACFHPAFDLLGVSASYGNAPPENTSYNARSLITAFGKANEIPIYAGALKPWVREPRYAPDIHGSSGLDGTTLLPLPKCELHTEESYLDAMEDAIVDNQGKISILSTGSLTSVATLFRERPHLKKMIKFLSIMGGGIGIGNINANHSAEFNIWVDPQAANFIFQDDEIKNKCILTPLNITHQAIATPDVINKIRGNRGSKLRQLFYELFLFFKSAYKDAQGFELGPPTHDPLTLMPLLQFYECEPQSLIGFEYRRLDLSVIDKQDSPDLGKLTILHEYSSRGSAGSMVGFNQNINYFWEQVYQALSLAERLSTIEDPQ